MPSASMCPTRTYASASTWNEATTRRIPDTVENSARMDAPGPTSLAICWASAASRCATNWGGVRDCGSGHVAKRDVLGVAVAHAPATARKQMFGTATRMGRISDGVGFLYTSNSFGTQTQEATLSVRRP